MYAASVNWLMLVLLGTNNILAVTSCKPSEPICAYDKSFWPVSWVGPKRLGTVDLCMFLTCTCSFVVSASSPLGRAAQQGHAASSGMLRDRLESLWNWLNTQSVWPQDPCFVLGKALVFFIGFVVLCILCEMDYAAILSSGCTCQPCTGWEVFRNMFSVDLSEQRVLITPSKLLKSHGCVDRSRLVGAGVSWGKWLATALPLGMPFGVAESTSPRGIGVGGLRGAAQSCSQATRLRRRPEGFRRRAAGARLPRPPGVGAVAAEPTWPPPRALFWDG